MRVAADATAWAARTARSLRILALPIGLHASTSGFAGVIVIDLLAMLPFRCYTARMTCGQENKPGCAAWAADVLSPEEAQCLVETLERTLPFSGRRPSICGGCGKSYLLVVPRDWRDDDTKLHVCCDCGRLAVYRCADAWVVWSARPELPDGVPRPVVVPVAYDRGKGPS